MKLITVLVFLCLMSFSYAYPIDIADDEEDIQDFLIKHQDDTAILYFVNQGERQRNGFWSSVFNLFRSSSQADEANLHEISENNPVVKIDLGKDTLAHAAEDYDVKRVPYVIAYHKGDQILAEEPTAKTADRIEEKLEEIESNTDEIVHSTTVHPERSPSEQSIWDEKSDTDEHHHPKPLQVTPDFGHIAANEPSESDLIKSQPIQELDNATDSNGWWSETKDEIGDLWSRFTGGAEEVENELNDTLSSFENATTNQWDNLTSELNGTLEGAMDQFENLTSQDWGNFSASEFENLTSSLNDTFGDVLDEYGNYTAGAWDNITAGGWDNITSKINETLSELTNTTANETSNPFPYLRPYRQRTSIPGADFSSQSTTKSASPPANKPASEPVTKHSNTSTTSKPSTTSTIQSLQAPEQPKNLEAHILLIKHQVHPQSLQVMINFKNVLNIHRKLIKRSIYKFLHIFIFYKTIKYLFKSNKVFLNSI